MGYLVISCSTASTGKVCPCCYYRKPTLKVISFLL